MNGSFHIRRSNVASQHELIQYNGIRSTKWVTPPEGKSVLEIQTTHRPRDLQAIPPDQNLLTPPYHWHWYQDEYFTVKQGRYIFTLEGKDTTVSASDPQPVHIPVRARHTFRVDDTCEGPCVIEISTGVSPHAPTGQPEAEGASERFFRNIYQYLDDCWVQGKSPSLPQLLLQLDSAEVSLALPGPAWLAHPISYAMGVVIGRWFGGYVLGYKASYPEYYNEEESKKISNILVQSFLTISVGAGESRNMDNEYQQVDTRSPNPAAEMAERTPGKPILEGFGQTRKVSSQEVDHDQDVSSMVSEFAVATLRSAHDDHEDQERLAAQAANDSCAEPVAIDAVEDVELLDLYMCALAFLEGGFELLDMTGQEEHESAHWSDVVAPTPQELDDTAALEDGGDSARGDWDVQHAEDVEDFHSDDDQYGITDSESEVGYTDPLWPNEQRGESAVGGLIHYDILDFEFVAEYEAWEPGEGVGRTDTLPTWSEFQDILSSLPTSAPTPEDASCPVCLSDFEDSDNKGPVQLNCCGQHFCRECLLRWFAPAEPSEAKVKTCPTCRATHYRNPDQVNGSATPAFPIAGPPMIISWNSSTDPTALAHLHRSGVARDSLPLSRDEEDMLQSRATDFVDDTAFVEPAGYWHYIDMVHVDRAEDFFPLSRCTPINQFDVAVAAAVIRLGLRNHWRAVLDPSWDWSHDEVREGIMTHPACAWAVQQILEILAEIRDSDVLAGIHFFERSVISRLERDMSRHLSNGQERVDVPSQFWDFVRDVLMAAADGMYIGRQLANEVEDGVSVDESVWAYDARRDEALQRLDDE